MNIDVTGVTQSDFPLLRAYAEYRVFSALATIATELEHVRVHLASDFVRSTMSCTIQAQLREGTIIRVRSRCRQPTKAIDRAAGRLVNHAVKRLERLRRH